MGAPVGNFNALKDGKRSPRKRAERWAARQAEWAEERARFAAWAAPIEARCRRQHAGSWSEIEPNGPSGRRPSRILWRR